jgi:pyrroline-5-carboxylate reductase
MVLLGVKPQKLDEVAPTVAPVLDRETILVSILAGVELATLRTRFPAPRNIVRAMPNTPVRLGKGVIDLHGGSIDEAARQTVTDLMTPLGLAEWFDDEQSFALAGLRADQAQRLATAMVEGAGGLAAAAPDSPAELARRVASPGGTTEAGLEVLDAEGALHVLMLQTLEASRRRGHDMAEAARSKGAASTR